MKPALRIVPRTQQDEAVELLEALIPDLFRHRDVAAGLLRDYDAKIAESLRLLAKARGVAFIRVETARREFAR